MFQFEGFITEVKVTSCLCVNLTFQGRMEIIQTTSATWDLLHKVLLLQISCSETSPQIKKLIKSQTEATYSNDLISWQYC